MTAPVLEGRKALRSAFLEAMSFTASTVSIVTTDGPAGRAGVTVSAMSSVSADTPQPSLLVCLHREARATRLLLANRVFCVNVLCDDQATTSDIFAGRIAVPDADRFAGVDWVRGATGAPRARAALASFDCRLADERLVGTHHVVFGTVESVTIAGSGSPLIYCRRAYSRPLALAG